MPELSPALYRAGEGEPLVLIHGFTATWRCWLPVLGLLVPRFEVIAPTLHGHDGGPPPPHGARARIAHAADHFEPLLDELGVGDRALRGQLDGRRAGARAGQARPRAQRRRDLARRRLGGGRPREVERIIRLFKRNQKQRRGRPSTHHEQLLAPARLPPASAMRDVMARGHLVPAEEAVLLTRSSIALQRRRRRLRDDAQRHGRASSTSTR